MYWEIAFVVFLLALTALVIMLMPVVMQLKESVGKLNQTLDTVNKDLPEVMSNLKDISGNLTTTTVKVETAINSLAEIEEAFTRQIKARLATLGSALSTVIQLVGMLSGKKKKK
ncbi:MAG TPA: hypothetical protein ENJ10_14890 [Caldithrix abyssi]|uniref:DUF948 domain-containing protein n=1 Tax=Caldithrix abyssi TaxID=187145 RepID=A0A7V1LPZ7_CALAY|nr:hypothetical protein [Caldithrix abyssi]